MLPNYLPDSPTPLDDWLETISAIERVASYLNVRVPTLAKAQRLALFTHLTHRERERAMTRASNYLDFLSAIVDEDISLDDEVATLRAGLRVLGLTGPSDLYDLILKDEIVEIYGADEIQIFRNLRYMDLTQYSLEHLITHRWDELYRRNVGINSRLRNETRLVRLWNARRFEQVPPHRVFEDLPGFNGFLDLKLRLKIPLYKTFATLKLPCALLVSATVMNRERLH